MFKKSDRNDGGRSMIEMLGVLAIVGVFSVGGMYGYSYAMAKYRGNKLIEQLGMTVNNIRSGYASRTYYDQISTAGLYDMGLIGDELCPDKCLNDGVNVFGGKFIVSPSDVKNAVSFDVILTGLPKAACMIILGNGINDAHGLAESLKNLTVRRAVPGGYIDTAFAPDKLPQSLSAAYAACSNDNMITWTVY
jgi:type II secretory pathway pseudopilin PulG